MREVSSEEAGVILEDLIEAIRRGEEVAITDGDRRVARLVPFDQPRHDRPGFGSAREAYDRSGLTWEDIDRALAPMGDDELKEWGIR